MDQPFFGSLALRLTLVEYPGIPTAATDGRRILYNPKFIEKLTLDETKGVLAHEVMHCATQHHTRRQSRDPWKWNIAADGAINPVLKAARFTLPEGHIDNPAWHGLYTEAIYPLIPDDPNGGQDGSDPGGCGSVMDATGPDGKPATHAELTEVDQDWKVATIQAAQQAKIMGKLPGGLERLLDEILNPKVDWRSVLRRFLEQTARNNYSWSMPNRRYIQQGLYLPTLYGTEEGGKIVVVVDTSGSIGGPEINQFAGELSGMLETFLGLETIVLYCDTQVAHVETFTHDDLPLQLHPKGGGGTDFRQPFLWIKHQREEPKALVYLTDMCGTFPDEDPGYPVLWAAIGSWYENVEVPFGELVEIK